MTSETDTRSQRGQRRRAGVQLHTLARSLSADEIREVSGVDTTSPERTIVDCIDGGTQPEQVELAIRQALQRGLTTSRRLTDATAARSSRTRDLVERLMAETGEPRWLDEEEQAAWLALASVFLTLPGALDAQLQSDSRMSFYEYMVLSTLSHAPEETLRLRELAALTNGSLSRVSQVATRLESRGWVERRPEPTDGRTTLASLTAAGRKELVKAALGRVEAVRRLALDPLTKAQVRQLREINGRIRKAVERGAARSSERTAADLFAARTFGTEVRTARHSSLRPCVEEWRA